jgi:4-amino-4-deoxy-L-arabinose transferase-like glycosyltransferase
MRVIWEARWAHRRYSVFSRLVYSRPFAAKRQAQRDSSRRVFGSAVGKSTSDRLSGLLFAAFVLAQRNWRMIRAAKLHLGVPILMFVAVPWFYLVSQATDGKWLADFIFVHHLQRYTAGAGHRQPIYYYFKTLPVDLLPWTIFAIPALYARRDLRAAWANPVTQFLLLWFLVIFVFFSLSDTKRELYLMPLLPPLALFVGNYFDALASARLPQDLVYRWAASAYFSLVVVAGVAVPVGSWFLRRDAFAAVLPASAALAAGGICAVFYIQRRRPLLVFTSVGTMMTATLFAAWLWIFPYLEPFKSPRHFSAMINKLVSAGAPLYIYADTMNDFNYYLEREVIPILPSAAAIDALFERRQSGYILIEERDLKRTPALSRQWIIASDGDSRSPWHLIDLGRRRAQ